MTIITKPSNDKSADKLVLPLFTEGGHPQASAPALSTVGDVEDPRVIAYRQRKSSVTTIFLFLSALAVMCMGILGGIAIYRLYMPSQADRMRFHGYCGVPYDTHAISDSVSEAMRDINNNEMNLSYQLGPEDFPSYKVYDDFMKANFFQEEFELDLSNDESYSKINVPLFKGGRRGRFIHDFKLNQTGIIDGDAGRCFIMPLDRDTVLPPKTLYDLLVKMYSGYYNIDTERVRKNFRVVLPELTDLSSISPKIATECRNMKVYLLEKYVSGVFKRDVHITDAGKFGGFSGKHIVEFDLVNINEIENFEKDANRK